MSMGTIGKLMKATRTQMIESQADRIARDFTTYFSMRDGDYIRVGKDGKKPTDARIMSVNDVYFNANGGWTASITIAPLLVTGQLGKTKSCLLTVNSQGKNLKAIHFYSSVERISDPR